MSKKYLALISAFNNSEVITVGLFDDYDIAMKKAEEAHEKYYTISRHYVIPLDDNESTYIQLNDHNKKYQQYCEKCKGTENLIIKNKEVICSNCDLEAYLKRQKQRG